MTDLTPHIDRVYYEANYPDIAAAGRDAAEHYTTTGWREGRNPNAWFDTLHYLSANPDVREAGINPLLHYLRQGQSEGRQAMPHGGGHHALLGRLEHPAQTQWIDTAPDAPVLEAADIADALRDALAAARGFALALSHDNYLAISGGTQAVIADEQRKYNGGGWTYLHLSPTRAGPTLAEIGRAPMLRMIHDGVGIGVAETAEIVAAMASLPLARIFIVHSLLGHEPNDVAALSEAVDAARNIFWAHDYFAACEGFRLLRNGLAFCAAPPPESMACHVCIHGDTRPTHLARIGALFDRVSFEMVAPSPLARDIWTSATRLPVRAARAHPHCRLVPVADRAPPQARGDAVRVAYVGMPDTHKGWPLFQDLVGVMGASPDYTFYHFADAHALRPLRDLRGVAATVRPDAPLAMVAALRDARIDLVLMLSPWPETFSLVTMEALAAGAEVLALATSGNAAALVAGSGTVLPNAVGLLAHFTSGEAAARARARRQTLTASETLLWIGTTATLDVPPGATMVQDPDLRFLLDNVTRRAHRRVGEHVLDVTGGHELRIVSRHAAPADLRPELSDRRRLGIALGRVALDGRSLPPHDSRFGAGWHMSGTAPFWTGGDARLDVTGARELALHVSRTAIYWRTA